MVSDVVNFTKIIIKAKNSEEKWRYIWSSHVKHGGLGRCGSLLVYNTFEHHMTEM